MAHNSALPPMPVGAAANSLEAMMAKKAQLDEDLRSVEKLIFDGEESYLEETAHYGNVVRGWDGFLTSRPRPHHAHASHHASKRSVVATKERAFSLSSASAPIEAPDGSADLSVEEMEMMGGGAPLSFRNDRNDRRTSHRSMAKGDDGDQSD